MLTERVTLKKEIKILENTSKCVQGVENTHKHSGVFGTGPTEKIRENLTHIPDQPLWAAGTGSTW